LQRVLQVVADEMLEESSDGGPPTVAGCRRVGSRRFDVVKEAGHNVGVQMLELEVGDLASTPLCSKDQQELQRIAVSPDGMGARATLLRQIFSEERFH
jgi:hypothetical protein